MKIPSKIYDVLKWIVMVCIPALTVAYVGLDSVFGWGYADVVAKVSAIICTLLGTLLGISSAQYYKELPEGDSEEDNENG